MLNTVSFGLFAPQYTSGYSAADALSFCLSSRFAYAKLPNNAIDRAKIRRQVKTWGFL